MKVRTLIRQLAMHDMDAEVWLAWQPPQVTSSMLVTGTSKMSRFGNQKVVYINSRQYAKKWVRNAIAESPKVAAKAANLSQAEAYGVNPTEVGTVTHRMSSSKELVKWTRKFKELSPELAGKPANLSVKQAKYLLDHAIED